jgi:uncharacterized membrane protein
MITHAPAVRILHLQTQDPVMATGLRNEQKEIIAMSDDSTTLVAASYAGEEGAKTILDALHDMHRGLTISLKDSAIVTRGSDGESELIGGIGDKLGSILENVRDSGITKEDMQRIADQLQPGQVALIALVSNDSVIATQSALEGFDGELIGPITSEAGIKKAYEAEASNKTLTDEPPGIDQRRSRTQGVDPAE